MTRTPPRPTNSPEASAALDRYRPTPLEVAMGWMPGQEPGHRPRPTQKDPVAALDDAIRPALLRRPCAVAFSGGRDSSLILARAVHLARREGLPPPVAIGYICPSAPRADESAWQELVVRHLGVEDWERVELRDQNDIVGEIAMRMRADLGPTFPALTHSRERLFERVRGGALLTGDGGDEALSGTATRTAAYLLRRKGLGRPFVYRRLFAENAPRALRRPAVTRGYTATRHWLRPEAASLARELLVEHHLGEPRSFRAGIWWRMERRAQRAGAVTFDLQAARYDATIHKPLTDPAFIASWTRAWPAFGPPNRTVATERLGADVLPAAVLGRRTKATFNETYFTETTRRFAREWDGSGVDPDLVDPAELRRIWLSEIPFAATSMLLQQAYAATHTRTA